jgi:4-hydroxybenzoate polyprenyltransferase
MRPIALLKLMRPEQWTKNLFLFVPLFFAGRLFQTELWARSVLGFVAFSLLASAVYVLNDWKDRESDRLHPTKRHRPLASGAVNETVAGLLFGSLVLGSGVMAYVLGIVSFAAILGGYFILNLAYTLRLKEVPLLDISLIALGFLLRVWGGGQLAGVEISHWLVIMTFLLALFLAIAKRRDDVLLMERTGQEMRKSIAGYSLPFVNTSMAVMASVVVVAYIQYTVSPDIQQKFHTNKLYLTVFFVVIGVLRYLQLALVFERSGSPTRVLLADRFTQLLLVGWLATFYLILYGPL